MGLQHMRHTNQSQVPKMYSPRLHEIDPEGYQHTIEQPTIKPLNSH